MARKTERTRARQVNRFVALVAGGVFALFGLAGPALADDAAVQYDTHSGPVTGTVGNGGTVTLSHTVANLSHPWLVVGVSLNNCFLNGYSVSGVTWVVGSTTQNMTRIQGLDNTAHTRRVEQWDLDLPTIGSGTVTVSFTTPVGQTVVVVAGAISLWNVTSRGPNACDTPPSGFEDEYPTRSVSTTYRREGLVDFFAVPGSYAAAYGSLQTERWNTCTGGCASSDLRAGGSTQPAAPGATTFTWTLSPATATSWVICAADFRPYQPTLAEVTEYSAVRTARGTLVRWRTSYEFDNLGFRVLREGPDGSRTQVTPSLVAGSALFAGQGTPLSAGRPYQWLDTGTSRSRSSRYWIEEVSLHGTSTLHGPVLVPASAAAFEEVPLASAEKRDSALLGTLGARASAAETAVPSSRAVRRVVPSSGPAFATQWQLASSAAAKIAVRAEGWYRVSKDELLLAGFDPGEDPAALRLFTTGEELAIGVRDGGDGRFDGNDAIEFYGTGQDTSYTDARVYWLVRDLETALPPRRIARAAAVQGTPGLASYEAVVERKDRTVYFAALMDPSRDNFFGPVIADQPVEQPLVVDHVARGTGGTGTLQVSVQGATTVAHRVGVILNGHDLGELAFSGVANAESTFSFDGSLVNEGANTVRLVARGGASDVSLVDRLRLTFPRTPFAIGDRISLVATPLASTTVQGFMDSHVRVMDVSRPDAVTELPVAVAGSASTFDATFTSIDQADVFAFSEAQALRPDSINANTPSSWHDGAHRAELVIVTHPDFAQAAQRLASLREQGGVATDVVIVDDAYDEFSFGAKDPQAIRSLLARSTSHWQQAPRFVLLFGDASMDPRDYLDQGAGDFVPTRMVPIEVLKSASDDWFVDFGDSGLPQMAVGRFPVRTAAEADTVVAKLVAYEGTAAGAEWTKRAVFVSDADDAELRVKFSAATTTLEGHIPSAITRSEISSGVLGQAEARSQTIAAINDGSLLVTYIGHGTDSGWAGGGQLFSAADAMALSNGAELPAVVALNCLNGLFEVTSGDSLAEALLKAPGGGAVVVLASSALTEAEGQTDLGTRFFDAALGSRLAVGEALRVAKAAEVRIGVRKSFLLFGDPSLKLKQ